MSVAPGSIHKDYNFSYILGTPFRTILQEYLMVISQTFLGLRGDGHVGMENHGVSTIGSNDLGGTGPQLLRMDVDGKVG